MKEFKFYDPKMINTATSQLIKEGAHTGKLEFQDATDASLMLIRTISNSTPEEILLNVMSIEQNRSIESIKRDPI